MKKVKIVIDKIALSSKKEDFEFELDEVFTIEDLKFNGVYFSLDGCDYTFSTTGTGIDDEENEIQLIDLIIEEILPVKLDFDYGEYGNLIDNFEISGCTITLIDEKDELINQWENY